MGPPPILGVDDPPARHGAVSFIHRFGPTLNPHLHFHCVVIDGTFDSATTGGVIFSAATGVDANACCGTTEGSSLVGLRPVTFALVRLRELDPERLLYERTGPRPGGNAPRLRTPLELLDRLAALAPPPRIHHHLYFGVLARTAAFWKSRRRG